MHVIVIHMRSVFGGSIQPSDLLWCKKLINNKTITKLVFDDGNRISLMHLLTWAKVMDIGESNGFVDIQRMAMVLTDWEGKAVPSLTTVMTHFYRLEVDKSMRRHDWRKCILIDFQKVL